MTETKQLDRIIEFHGHMCPGLAMGIRAAEAALDNIGPHSSDEEVVAIVETDMCGVDAIQFMTGCTFGKGNLVHQDYGKNAYTFIRRSDGKAVRLSARPGGWGQRTSELESLLGKVGTRTATPEERQRFSELQKERTKHILGVALDELYDVREVDVEAPRPARIHASIPCESCGEPTMETRIRRLDGRELCPPCFDQALSGTVRVSAPSRRG